MKIVAIIGAILGAILIWLKGGKGGKQKKFWKEVTDLIVTNQKKEEEVDKKIADAKAAAEAAELEIRNVQDAKIAAAEAVRLLRERHGWIDPTDESQ